MHMDMGIPEQPSASAVVVSNVITDHPDLFHYILRLIRIRSKDEDSSPHGPVLRRLGIRLLSLHLLGLSSKENVNDNVDLHLHLHLHLQSKDWAMVIDIFIKRCKQYEHSNIDWFDVELLNLLTMALEMNVNANVNDNANANANVNAIGAIPDLIMTRLFCNTGSSREEEEESKPTKQNNETTRARVRARNGEIAMVEVISTLLDGEYYRYRYNNNNNNQGVQESFCEAMVHFLVAHATFIQVSCNGNDHGNDAATEKRVASPLTNEFIQKSTGLLYGNKLGPNALQIEMSQETRSLLHYALLAYISRNVSISMESMECMDMDVDMDDQVKISDELGLLFHLSSTRSTGMQQSDRRCDLASSIQKLIFSGITSLDDSQERSSSSSSASASGGINSDFQNNGRNVNVHGMIRTMAIRLLANLMDNIGIEWMRTLSTEGSLGEAASFCMMTRLIAGEQRIVLGRLLDVALSIKDPDNQGNGNAVATVRVAPPGGEGWFEVSGDCIRIGLHALRTMLDMASDDDDDGDDDGGRPSHNIGIRFNPDAILHVRHSLEDFLDSCVQFLLEDISDDAFVQWRDCAHACCRYLGAYLAQVNVFDYDAEDNDDDNDESEEQSERKTTSSVNLLRAMRNGLNICLKSDMDSGRCSHEGTYTMRTMTLFPCLLATLACCENPRHTTIVEKHLLKDTTLSTAIETALNLIESKGYNTAAQLTNISWCCLLIESMLDFRTTATSTSTSTRSSKGQKTILNQRNLRRALSSAATHLLAMMQKGIGSNEEISGILCQVFDSWTTLADTDGRVDGEEENSVMMRVHSFLQAQEYQ